MLWIGDGLAILWSRPCPQEQSGQPLAVPLEWQGVGLVVPLEWRGIGLVVPVEWDGMEWREQASLSYPPTMYFQTQCS